MSVYRLCTHAGCPWRGTVPDTGHRDDEVSQAEAELKAHIAEVHGVAWADFDLVRVGRMKDILDLG